jgi:ferric-dicitrate binding protein FerR (iron transport regulator)
MEIEQNIEKLVQSYKIPAIREKEVAWEILLQKMDTTEPVFRIPFYQKKWLSIAASLLVILLFSFVVSDNFLFQKTYHTSLNQQLIHLKDGSTVTLNPQSKLVTNFSFFTGKRKMKLEGEAMFEVKKGKNFEVKIAGGKIEVLGTIFIVNAYFAENLVVNCIDGNVKVSQGKTEEILEAGTAVHMEKNNLNEPFEINIEKVISELNGNYFWTDEPLDEVFKLLEKRFAIKVEADKTIRERNFSGQVSLNSLNSALDVLSFAMNLTFEVNEKSKNIKVEKSN